MTGTKLRNIGPKSAAWLRQVGLRTQEDLESVGAVEAFIRVKRAGFRPSLNLLYALEGALLDCHWQQLPEARRGELLVAYDAAAALLPPPRGRPAAGPERGKVSRLRLIALNAICHRFVGPQKRCPRLANPSHAVFIRVMVCYCHVPVPHPGQDPASGFGLLVSSGRPPPAGFNRQPLQ